MSDHAGRYGGAFDPVTRQLGDANKGSEHRAKRRPGHPYSEISSRGLLLRNQKTLEPHFFANGVPSALAAALTWYSPTAPATSNTILIARFCVFLASDEASACTAQHYVVDAGWV